MSQLLTNIIPRLTLLCLLVSTVTATACAQRVANPQGENKAAPAPSNAQGVLGRDVPQKVDAKAKYLFYLHGAIIENEGVNAVSPRFGAYEYEQILNTFVNKGFVVISEPRPRGTDIEKYAAKVVGQVNALLKAGVPPQHITIVGGSRGGQIA
jgi:poly(3-hydroxybutyrate) depolymerase